MTTTTWTAFLAQLDLRIQAYIDNGQLERVSITTPEGVTTQYASLKDLMAFRNEVSGLAQAESSTTTIKSAYGPINFRRGFI